MESRTRKSSLFSVCLRDFLYTQNPERCAKYSAPFVELASEARTGLDFETVFSGSIAAISNTCVGAGDMIGPSGNFAGLPDAAIWIMSFGMLFGRVEFLAIMVLLTPRFWKV